MILNSRRAHDCYCATDGSIYTSKNNKFEQPPYGFPSDAYTTFYRKILISSTTSCPLVVEIYLGGKHIFQFLISRSENL
jgi:hypothetical protein